MYLFISILLLFSDALTPFLTACSGLWEWLLIIIFHMIILLSSALQIVFAGLF